MKGLRVGNYDEQTQTLINDRAAVDERQVFPPDGLLLFTRNPEQVWSFYPIHDKSVFYTVSLPSLPNGSGSCAIANASFHVLDSMAYDGDMHSAFLRDFRGVSLERLDATLPSMDRSTWISAAESVGWATPGVKNSQTLPIVNFTGKLTLAPEVFRPNNSGEDDVLQVMYDLPQNGCIGSLYVYDPSGQKIVTVAEHRLLENRGRLIWDGKDQDGRRVRGGLYLIVMELTEPKGTRTVLKDACAVVY